MDEENKDPYWKLKPPEPTPADELCSCKDPDLLLQPHLSYNPLCCFECNGEVEPEFVGFGAEVSETMAFWSSFHDSFYQLWLDSGEFEEWAKSQLLASDSPVNMRALEIVGDLNEYRRSFYSWFHDADDSRPSECPKCADPLGVRGESLVCDGCSIVIR